MRSLALLSTAWMLALAAPAMAQSAPSSAGAGLRYLAWPGKAAPMTGTQGLRPALGAPAPSSTPAGPPGLIGRTVAASAPAPAPTRLAGPVLPPARQGLTPASDWLRPVSPAAAAPSLLVAAPLAPPILPPPDAPVGAPDPAPVPVASPVSAVDPRAPRRDAPIFRLQAPASAPSGTPAAQAAPPAPAVGQGARYYSLHRQNGRQPDAIPQTQPVYLDGLPVELIQPPNSADLAQPPEPPALFRNAEGRLQAAPQSLPDNLP